MFQDANYSDYRQIRTWSATHWRFFACQFRHLLTWSVILQLDLSSMLLIIKLLTRLACHFIFIYMFRVLDYNRYFSSTQSSEDGTVFLEICTEKLRHKVSSWCNKMFFLVPPTSVHFVPVDAVCSRPGPRDCIRITLRVIVFPCEQTTEAELFMCNQYRE
jgi:hypothetical protein